MSTFESITYGQDEETQDFMIILDNKWILGKYMAEEIPDIIAWIGKSIAQHKSDEHLCLTMPMSAKKEVTDAENDSIDTSERHTQEVSAET